MTENQSNKTVELLAAIRENDASLVAALLDSGADPNLADRPDHAPLAVAMREEKYKAAEILLACKRLELAAHGYQVAVDAVIAGNTDALDFLAAHGYPLTEPAGKAASAAATLDRATALIFASISVGLPRAEIIKYLLRAGARADASIPGNGETLTVSLSRRANTYPGIMKLFLDAGASPEQPDDTGLGPLHYSSFYGHADYVETLLSAGAPVDQQASDGSFPLLWAAAGCNGDVRNILLNSDKMEPEEYGMPGRLSDRWNLAFTGSDEGEYVSLSLDRGDGGWNITAKAVTEEDTFTRLQRHVGARRGMSEPFLIARLKREGETVLTPAPRCMPAELSDLRAGDSYVLRYIAPLLPKDKINSWPEKLTPRFIILKKSKGLPAFSYLPAEIVRIVVFYEGYREDIKKIAMNFKEGRWMLR